MRQATLTRLPLILVFCDECGKWISDEERHECYLRPAVVEHRELLRAVKQSQAWRDQ